MKNKKLAIGLATTASFAVIGLSAFALFTARDDSDWIAKAGTVDIELDNLKLSNSDNINPGDNDPNNPKDAAKGTSHVFEYTVSNFGTKSVRTRHTILLTITDADDSSKLLDARYVGLYKSGKEIGTRTYILKDGTEVSSFKDKDEVKAVKYVFMGDIFDGYGTSIADGGNAEKEALDGVIKADKDTNNVDEVYSYDFTLLRGADNEYQAADFKIDVVIEAMQYRNTNETDWATVTTVSKTFSSAEVINKYVPAQDEDNTGKKISSEFLDHMREKSSSENK